MTFKVSVTVRTHIDERTNVLMFRTPRSSSAKF